MNIVQILAGLKDETLPLKLVGHQINSLTKRLEQQVTHLQERLTADFDTGAKIKITVEGMEHITSYGQLRLERLYSPGDYIEDLNPQCFNCGADNAILFMGDHITLIPNRAYWEVCESRYKEDDNCKTKYDYFLVPDDVPFCGARSHMSIKKLISFIQFPTGIVSFRNYFEPERIYEMPEEGSASINSILGRDNLMQYLASENVGYGQMGNTSIEVWKKDNEILITMEYDHRNDEENLRTYPGYTHHGSISLSVWRWMCADQQTLAPYEVECTAEIDAEENYAEEILIRVTPGQWKIEHYYDFHDCEEDGIYSRLTLQ